MAETTVRMKATDTLHISSVRADAIRPGDTFDVSGVFADDLEKRGLATRVSGKAAKAEEAPQNKDEGAAPTNKADATTVTTRRAARAKR